MDYINELNDMNNLLKSINYERKEEITMIQDILSSYDVKYDEIFAEMCEINLNQRYNLIGLALLITSTYMSSCLVVRDVKYSTIIFCAIFTMMLSQLLKYGKNYSKYMKENEMIGNMEIIFFDLTDKIDELKDSIKKTEEEISKNNIAINFVNSLNDEEKKKYLKGDLWKRKI